MEDKVQSLIVPAILESDSGGITSNVPLSRSRASVSSEDTKPLSELGKELERIYKLLSTYAVDPEVISQIFKQVILSALSKQILNKLLI